MYIFFLKGRNLKCCEYCGVCVCACVCVCECMCAVSSVGLHPSACRKCFGDDSHMQGSVCMKIRRKNFQLDSVHFFFER